MIGAPPPQQPAQAPQDEGPKVGLTWGLSIGVPIFLNVDSNVVRPGAALGFFAGADFGFFVLGGDLGIQWNPIDLGNVPGVTGYGRHPATRLYFSLPEVRFRVPDLDVVLPYITGAFDMNFWNFQETALGCGYWYCNSYDVYRFTPGFTGKAGLGFNVKGGVYLDMGFQYSFSGKGSFFPQSQWWLAPYVGVLVRKR